MSSIAPTLSAGLMQAQIIASQPAVLSNVDVAALMQENKWLKDKVAQYERVLFATHCKVTDRVVLACAMYMAYEQGKPDANNANFATAQYSGEAMSKQLGLSKVTIYNSLKKWEDVGLIQRQQSPVAKDQFGQEVDPKAIPTDRQCHWESVSYLTAPLTLTDIPSLPETSYERKAKDKAKATSELAKLAQQLKTLTCPECGANGTLEITCSACGCKTDEHNASHHYEIVAVESTTNIQPVIDQTPQEQLSAIHSSTSSTSLGVQVDNPTIIETRKQQPAQIEVLSLSDAIDRSSVNTSLSGGAEGLPVLAASPDQIIEDTPETTIPPLSDVSLKGADILIKLQEMGARFSLVQPKAKAAIARDYLVNPPSFAVALRHLKAGGNVGLLTGDMSAGMVAIDIDRGLGDFLRIYPEFAAYPRCVRANAPDRGKILIRVGAGQAKHVVLETLPRKAEFIGDKYHVIVAGIHETGAELVLLNADRAIPVVDASKVLAKLVAWVG
ncbi:MAG: hypothetical protein KIH63_002275, partial [Candidatus Saccharibacteria bacterium]|nr:hypothetical protein [Candidatus Saccharibacteria bacterium]